MTYLQPARAFVAVAAVAPPGLSSEEVMAIDIGLADARRDRDRSAIVRLFRRFSNIREQPLANASLEALRAFGQLAPTIRKTGQDLSLALLEANGFSSMQIAAVLNLIAGRLGAAKW